MRTSVPRILLAGGATLALAGAAVVLAASPGSAAPLAAAASPVLTRVSTDPFTNSGSQHATEVEPDTFAFGNTIVASSQVGRFASGGASDISFDTSTNGGTTWTSGMLPGITTFQGSGSFGRVSSPSTMCKSVRRQRPRGHRQPVRERAHLAEPGAGRGF